ncbi:hypothetical protein DFJ74DRAFT_94200 [Hyaloraphidium curvatum]|nr:hypothetical protein DFJ74DRAFT_94200 [Hyaloraphidium curvatum]
MNWRARKRAPDSPTNTTAIRRPHRPANTAGKRQRIAGTVCSAAAGAAAAAAVARRRRCALPRRAPQFGCRGYLSSKLAETIQRSLFTVFVAETALGREQGKRPRIPRGRRFVSPAEVAVERNTARELAGKGVKQAPRSTGVSPGGGGERWARSAGGSGLPPVDVTRGSRSLSHGKNGHPARSGQG